MAFNVANFRSSILNHGILRPNKFRVRVFNPPGLAASSMAAEMELWGEMAEIPMFQLGTGTMQRYGYGSIERRPVMPQYQEISLFFFADEAGEIWRFFKEWLRLIVNNDANAGEIYSLAYKNEYLADLEMTLFTATGEESFTVTLIDAFPLQLGKLDLKWSDNNQILRIPVVFTYTNWIET
jgi:hypothetical protein